MMGVTQLLSCHLYKIIHTTCTHNPKTYIQNNHTHPCSCDVHLCRAYALFSCFHAVTLSAASISSAIFVRSHSRLLTFHTKSEYCCRFFVLIKLVIKTDREYQSCSFSYDPVVPESAALLLSYCNL